MKRITTLLAIFTVIILVSCSTLPTTHQEETIPYTWEVHFSPHGGCTDAIIKELNKAQSTILVQAYYFTSVQIAETLLTAHKRGVKVEVILDKSQRTDLLNAGISVKIDAQHRIAHNKVMVIDEETVITGSFNFTKAAEEDNAENLLVIHDKKLASLYMKNWQEHAQHSEVYKGRGR